MAERHNRAVKRKAPRLRAKWVQNLLLATVVALAITFFWPPERTPAFGQFAAPLHVAERTGYDALFAIRGPVPARIHPDIVVLGFDRSTEQDLGVMWPPSRELHAAAIRRLKADGADMIVYDVLFTGPTTVEADRDLHAALIEAGNVVLTFRIDRDRAFSSNIQAKRFDGPYYDEALGIDFEQAAMVGFAEVTQDLDDVVRNFTPTLQLQGEWMPSVAVAAYQHIHGLEPEAIEVGPDAIRVGDARIPRTGPTGIDAVDGSPAPSALVDFPAGAASFPSPATFQQVVRGEFTPGTFKGKIVFVGVTGIDLTKATNDQYATAYTSLSPEVSGAIAYREIPGVVVQAQMLNAMLTNGYLRYASPALVFGLVFVCSFWGTTLVRRFANWRGPLLLVVVAALYIGVAITAFLRWHTHIPYVIPTVVMLGSAGLVAWLERGAMRRKWSGYVSPGVLEVILREEDFAAQRYEATVIFGDIRGFTSFSDQHPPERVVRLLNQHFERMTKILYDEEGTIDKFLGDGILCVFGAPVPLANAAIRAVRASWHMREIAMTPVVDGGESFVLATGFGITTGPFVAGHVGSKQRHDFTIIGDVVNVAARLQGVTGEPDVIIDAPTYELVKAYAEVESLGEVVLKGKPLPVACYRVTAWREPA